MPAAQVELLDQASAEKIVTDSGLDDLKQQRATMAAAHAAEIKVLDDQIVAANQATFNARVFLRVAELLKDPIQGRDLMRYLQIHR